MLLRIGAVLLGQQSVSYLERCLSECHLHRWTHDSHLHRWRTCIWTAGYNINRSLMNFSQVNIVFQALLVGPLQAEDLDQWQMWECQVSKCIETGTMVEIVPKVSIILTLAPWWKLCQKHQNILTLVLQEQSENSGTSVPVTQTWNSVLQCYPASDHLLLQ